MKNCYDVRMTTPASPTTGVQLLDVPPELAGQRIDNFLIARLKGAPKTLIYRILRKGEVRVNKGRIKPDYRLQAGDQVRVPPLRLAERDEPAPPGAGAAGADGGGDRLRGQGADRGQQARRDRRAWRQRRERRVIEVFRQLRPDAKDIELVHRLDRDTSGLLMIAKKRSMLRHLHEDPAGREDRRQALSRPGPWPLAGWQEERARAAAEEQPAFGRANGRGERRGQGTR